MVNSPHLDKLKAALLNKKCSETDKELISKSIKLYHTWISKMDKLDSKGQQRVNEMVDLLNWYKDEFEIGLIMKQGSPFLKRQKGQLKLDSSIIEEFLIYLINPNVIKGMDKLENINDLIVGPTNTFMSLAFFPKSFEDLINKPDVILKTKDQDFIIGSKIFYKFSSTQNFEKNHTVEGNFALALLAAECKVNLDKTMFQEAAGTAFRLKQGCPISKYFLLVEYLDMQPEDSRLTAIDNVFLLRRAKRLPFEKRDNIVSVEKQRKEFPIDKEVVWRFVQEIQTFFESILYDHSSALKRGSFS